MKTFFYPPIHKYFLHRVRDIDFVKSQPEAQPIITATIYFMTALDTPDYGEGEFATPKLAIPRLPHDILFAIGGWYNGAPTAMIETYDTRADRWISIDNADEAGARAYHGTAVLGHRVFCIGNFLSFALRV